MVDVNTTILVLDQLPPLGTPFVNRRLCSLTGSIGNRISFRSHREAGGGQIDCCSPVARFFSANTIAG